MIRSDLPWQGVLVIWASVIASRAILHRKQAKGQGAEAGTSHGLMATATGVELSLRCDGRMLVEDEWIDISTG
ncbi:MAG: hypothetical protein U1E76_21615 [Planctomycetota bacterium]